MWGATPTHVPLPPPHLARLLEADSLREPVNVTRDGANHLSLASVALHCIGGTEDVVNAFEALYLSERRGRILKFEDNPQVLLDGRVDLNSFSKYLGSEMDVFNYREFFRAQIVGRGLPHVLQEVLDQLNPWLHLGQWHPLLRLTCIVASGHPDNLLFADGLAYLATKAGGRGSAAGSLQCCDKLCTRAPGAPLPRAAEWQPGEPTAIWADLRASNIRGALVEQWLTAQLRDVHVPNHPHEDVESVLGSQLLCSVQEVAAWALGGLGSKAPSAISAESPLVELVKEMGALAIRFFLTIPRGSTLHGFTVVQGVAVLLASGVVPPKLQACILSRFWVWLTSLYVEKGTPALVSLIPQGEEAMGQVGWDHLLPRAAAMIEHAHVIKLAFSCHWWWTIMSPDALLKLAVLRALEAGHPWRADQSFICESYLRPTAEYEAFRSHNRAHAKAHVQALLNKTGSWDAAWQQRTTPWDLCQANTVLARCEKKVPWNARCLLPGCGSGYDLVALASGTRSVHGLEVSETAACVARRTAAGCPNVEVIIDDFFAFSGAYDFIFDHTFFCALPPSHRVQWAQKMAELLRPEGRLLAVIWPLGQPSNEISAGPPFMANVELYHQLLAAVGLELEELSPIMVSDGLGTRSVAVTWWRRSGQSAHDLADIERVHRYWFDGEHGSKNPDDRRTGCNLTQVQFWMSTIDGGRDALIKSEFEDLYNKVRLDPATTRRWTSTAKGCLALVILCDQFPRHMFRGTARMFESDEIALEVATHALQIYGPRLAHSDLTSMKGAEKPFGWPLTWCEVWFLSLTWCHSEQLSDQTLGISHLKAAIAVMPESRAGDAGRAHMERALCAAHKHKEILLTYGRFPHRNAVLGREPSELEDRLWSPQNHFETTSSGAAVWRRGLLKPHAVSAPGKALLKLWLTRYSANCLGPWLTLRWLKKHCGVRIELVDVDILNAQQMAVEYTHYNPNHTVPLLLDFSQGPQPVAVFESHAIMRYLVRRFHVTEVLEPPTTSALGASICWALEFRLARLYPALEKVSYPAMGFSQDFDAVLKWKFRLDATLRDFEAMVLPDSTALIGGSQTPTIADFAIAPCLHLVSATDFQLPVAVSAYVQRFEAACPDAVAVMEGDGGFGILRYLSMRDEFGYLESPFTKEYSSSVPRSFEALPACQTLVLSGSPHCVDSLPLRILLALPAARDIAADTLLELQPTCGDPLTSEVPLFRSKQGQTFGGCNAILRHLCGASAGLQNLYPRGLQERAETDAGLDFCCTVLRRFTREALYPLLELGNEEIERVPQARCRLVAASKVVERWVTTSGLIGSASSPTIADLAVVPCLLAFPKLGLDLSKVLRSYISRCCDYWQGAQDLLTEVAARGPASTLALAFVERTDLDRLQASADQELHHLGSLADSYSTTVHKPMNLLPPSHASWDELAAELPNLLRNLQLRSRMDGLPVLDASPEALPERFLARASSLLAIFAHCYWHSEFNNLPASLPVSILQPWEQVTKRFCRPTPVMNYEDLYTYNWRGDPRQVTTMRLATPSTGSVAEQRFYLGTVAISHAGAPILELASRAARQCQMQDPAGLVLTLKQIDGCIQEMHRVFGFLSLRQGSPGFVDPVHWTMTVATFAMTFVDKLGYPKAIAPSGNSLPVLHILDAVIGRNVYKTELSQATQKMLGHEVMAAQHREAIAAIRKLNLRDLVQFMACPEVIEAWNSMIMTYLGHKGFLGAHRRKVFGFIMVAAVVGRPSTLLDFKLNVQSFQQSVEEVNSLLLQEVDARRATLIGRKSPSVPSALWTRTTNDRATPMGDLRCQTVASVPRQIDLEELCCHNSSEDLWVAIAGHVYDLTNFTKTHPGGKHVIGYLAGLDATKPFNVVHSYVRLPDDLCKGAFAEPAHLSDEEPFARFLKQATLFLNAARIEYHSVCQHYCLCDEYQEHAQEPEPVWSPYNLMMLLRMYHKLLGEMLPVILEEMAAFSGVPTLAHLTLHPALVAFKFTTAVPENIRSGHAAEMLAAARAIRAAQMKMVSAVDKVRALGLTWFRSGTQLTEADVAEALAGCLEAAETLVSVFDAQRAVTLSPLFAKLPPAAREALVAKIKHRASLEAGAMIATAGDHANEMHFVLAGEVSTVATSPPGKDNVVRTVGRGGTIGVMEMLFARSYESSFTTVQGPCALASLQRADVEGVMAQYDCHENFVRAAMEVVEVREWFVTRLPAFRVASRESGFVRTVARRLHSEYRSVGDAVVAPGQVDSKVFLLVTGRISVAGQVSEKPVELHAPVHVMEWEALLGLPWRIGVTCNTDCNLFTLYKSDLDAIFDSYPDLWLAPYGDDVTWVPREQSKRHSPPHARL